MIFRGIFALTLVGLTAISGATAEQVPGFLMGSPPNIDGEINIEEWKNVPQNTGFVEQEDKNKPALVESKFWIAYDNENIYLAIQNFDPNPSKIIANAYQPNSSMNGDDTVILELDIIGTLNDWNRFSMNPKGANSMRLAGGKAAKTEWLGEFITKSRITESGWETEAKIPWKLMRLPQKGARNLRFNIKRYYPLNQRTYIWRNVQNRPEDTPILANVQVPELPLDRSIKVLQYGVVGAGDTKPIFNTGFDFRTNLARSIEAVGTINPDFRNVTQGVQSLNFSYFEQLTDDNRPFFAEGSNFFRTGFGSRIFASQRVRSFDIGAKVFGKISEDTSFGLMNLAAIGEENTTVLSINNNPSNRSNYDFAVVNYQTKLRENTAIFTNAGYGTGDYFLYMGNEFTKDKQTDFGHKFKLGINQNTKNSYAYGEIARVEKDFTPRLGFQPERNIIGVSGGFGFNQRYSKGRVSESSFNFGVEKFERLNGARYRQEVGASFDLDFHNVLSFDGSASVSRFNQYDDSLINFGLRMPRGNPNKSFSLKYTFGHLSGKPYKATGVGLTYRFPNRLIASLSLNAQDHFDKSTQIIGNVNWDLGRNQSFSSRFVRRNEDYNVFFSYRKSGTLGTDYYLIVGDPNARSFKSTVILKIVYPFDIKF